MPDDRSGGGERLVPEREVANPASWHCIPPGVSGRPAMAGLAEDNANQQPLRGVREQCVCCAS
jgi:hypothetical protein